MAFISINYNEGTSTGYTSVEFHYGRGKKEEKRIFNSGEFVKDWYDMRKFMITEANDEYHYSHSSSVDHFIMDGAPYDSAYLLFVNDKPVLVYIGEITPDNIYAKHDIYEEGIEFFVEKGTTPTWEELKEKYGK